MESRIICFPTVNVESLVIFSFFSDLSEFSIYFPSNNSSNFPTPIFNFSETLVNSIEVGYNSLMLTKNFSPVKETTPTLIY